MEENRENAITKVTVLGGVCNFILLVFKFIAGIIGQSGAMMADAMHSLSDFATDAVVLVFVRISAKPTDKSHDYGHGKFETLATMIIAVALFAVAGGIIVNGAKDIACLLNGGTIPQPGLIAFAAAAVSIAVKEGLYWYTLRCGKRWNSPVVIANAWHHRSDALSSVATLVAVGLACFLGEKWVILDPIAAIVVGAILIKVAYSLLMPAVNDLLEHSLPDEVENEILQIITSDERVREPHNLRTRRIGSRIAIEVHIRLDAAMTVADSHAVTVGIERNLREKYGAETWVMIHVEPYVG